MRLDKHEDMVEAYVNDIMARSTKAESASICQGALVDLLGYQADTETAIEILEGRFEPPEDMDGPTLLLFEEMGPGIEISKPAFLGSTPGTLTCVRKDFLKVSRENWGICFLCPFDDALMVLVVPPRFH